MEETKKLRRNGIDFVQGKTIDEHFEIIVSGDGFLSRKHTNRTYNDLPEWFDEKRFKRAQKFYADNIASITIGQFVGLIAVFLIPSIAELLASTKQSSTPCAAYKRYMQTLLLIHYCYIYDIQDSTFYKSINAINWKHNRANNMFSHLKISHKDMVLTQFGFIAYNLIYGNKLGINSNDEDNDAFNHFWAVMGHMLGIPDRMNLCRKDYRETVLLIKKIMDNVFSPQFNRPNENFYNLAKSSIDGLSSLNPLNDEDATLLLLHQFHNKTYEKELNLRSKLIFWYTSTVFRMMCMPYIGRIVRFTQNIYARTLIYFNTNYSLISWIRFGKEKSKLCIFPKISNSTK